MAENPPVLPSSFPEEMIYEERTKQILKIYSDAHGIRKPMGYALNTRTGLGHSN